MTPCQCRNCNRGLCGNEIIPVRDIAGDVVDIICAPIGCSCCQGDYWDCKSCEREFPNSVEAVQMGND